MSDFESPSFLGKMKKDPLPAVGKQQNEKINPLDSIILIHKKGMAGFFGVIAYAAYNYRRKAADTKTSVYVIQTRVAAQGLVIGLMLYRYI